VQVQKLRGKSTDFDWVEALRQFRGMFLRTLGLTVASDEGTMTRILNRSTK